MIAKIFLTQISQLRTIATSLNVISYQILKWLMRGTARCLPVPMFPSPYVPYLMMLVPMFPMYPSPYVPQNDSQSRFSPKLHYPVLMFPSIRVSHIPASICFSVPMFPNSGLSPFAHKLIPSTPMSTGSVYIPSFRCFVFLLYDKNSKM